MTSARAEVGRVALDGVRTDPVADSVPLRRLAPTVESFCSCIGVPVPLGYPVQLHNKANRIPRYRPASTVPAEELVKK